LVLGRRPLGTVLHSSNEPGVLSQWICCDESTINIVLELLLLLNDDNANVRNMDINVWESSWSDQHTRHFSRCTCGQTELQEPSTSLV